MHGIKKLCSLFFLLTVFSMVCGSVRAVPAAVPDALEPWRAWVLEAHKDLACPPQYAELGERFCRWPGQLQLQVDERGASFTQSWQLYREGWVTLPGDVEQWPQDVLVDKKPAQVVEHDGAPSVLLPAGEHQLQGVMRWDALPTRLALPAGTGLLALTVQGKPVAQPSIDAQGYLLFGENRAPVTVADTLAVQVFRQVQDGIPLQMETVLRLRVAGRDREVLLGQFLLDGFVPLALDTPLPARIEADGRLRVQLRAGEWELVLRARAEGQPASFSPKKLDDSWPAEEVWSWQADRQLRQVTPASTTALDPSQTDMPAVWRQAPAWLLAANDTLTLTETQRGDVVQPGDTASDALSLRRELWLDFDGSGMSSRDVVSGSLRQASRFSAAPAQTLGRVEVNGEPQLVTRLGSQQNEAGVELRAGALNLLSVSRLAQFTAVPITAWQREMDSVFANLYLPPGWLLLHAEGVDSAAGSWLARWNLWAIFLVLIVAAASWRLLGVGGGVVALLALMLTYHAGQAPVFLWLAALIGTGLLRALPAGRFRQVIAAVNSGVLLVLVLLLLNFAVEQARSAIYPQLELGRAATIQQGGAQTQSGVIGAAMQVADDMVGGAQVAMEAIPAAAPAVRRAESADYPSKMKRATKPAQEPSSGYDPSAQVQTGPGEPAWRWQTVSLYWSGPVLQDQTVRLYLLSPILHKIWRLASVLLAFAFALLLLRAAWPNAAWRKLAASKAVAPVLLLAGLLLQGQPVWAQETNAAFPSKAMLDELEQRLTRAPDCAPQCAALNRGQVQISGNVLRIQLQIDAQIEVAVPLPAAEQWQPRAVLVDGMPTQRLRRDENGHLWLAVTAGSHSVVLEGEVAGDALQLPFSMSAHNISASAEGWQISGLSEGRIPGNSLQLSRNAPTEKAGNESARLLPDTAPPFVRVTRRLMLGLDWQVQTTVERIAPAVGAINLAIPLLLSEAVLTDGVVVRDGLVQVVIAPDAQTFSWTATLKPAATLNLTAAKAVSWIEVWQWDIAPIWHVAFSGLNPVKQESASAVMPVWQPWPGESLSAEISRPQGVAGSTRTVESVNLDYRPGARSVDTSLSLQVRSSQGGELPLSLPVGAKLQRVAIDGVEQSNPALPDAQLKLPLHPGSQRLDVSWRQETDMGWRITTPQPQLHEPLNNIQLSVQMPEGRWLLAVGGPLMGPALLYWGVLTVMVLVAIVLGRSGVTPVATWQWVLLGLGMSTVNAVGSVLVVAWFVAMAYRRKANTAGWSCGNLQLTQVVLVILSVLALGSLVGTIPASLLSSPEMQVVGNQSTISQLLWYQDRGAVLPQAWVVSVPMWVYRAAMLLWSLWLVFSMMAWCRWGWQCFSSGELWRSTLPRNNKAAATTVSETKL